jgi:hypothetical protein
MARTRWPPGPVNPGLLPRPGRSDRQRRQRRQVPKTWARPTDRLAGQPGRRQPNRRSGWDPGPRPYARTQSKPGKPGRKHYPQSPCRLCSVGCCVCCSRARVQNIQFCTHAGQQANDPLRGRCGRSLTLLQCIVMRARGSRRWRGELIGGCAANRRLSALCRRSVFPFRAERRAEANSAEPGPPVGAGLRGTSDLGMAEVRRAVRVRLAGRHPAVDRRLSTAWRNVSASACAEIRSAG